MVLIVDGKKCSQRFSLDDLEYHKELVNRSVDFASQTEHEQTDEEIRKTIYVHQREFAVLAKNDQNRFQFIGSDDATTCHILILDNQVATGLVHLDGSETELSIMSMLNELKKYAPENTEYDVYISGGFNDQPKRMSYALSNEILNLFSDLPESTFNLKLATITKYNNYVRNGTDYPCVYGVCFNVNTKVIRKMRFTNYGPAFRLRTVYVSLIDSAWCVYSSLVGKIILKRIDVQPHVVNYYAHLYRNAFASDKKLLSLTSTSPDQERPSYLNHMRKTILYILKYSKQISNWFDNETHSIVYSRSNDFKWITDNTKIVDDIEIE